MKITIWEKHLIHSILGLISSENIREIETLLEMRKNFKVSKEEKKAVDDDIDGNFDDDIDKSVYGDINSIHEDEVEVSLKMNELKYLLGKMEMDGVKLPSGEKHAMYTINLYKKLKEKQEQKEEV